MAELRIETYYNGSLHKEYCATMNDARKTAMKWILEKTGPRKFVTQVFINRGKKEIGSVWGIYKGGCYYEKWEYHPESNSFGYGKRQRINKDGSLRR